MKHELVSHKKLQDTLSHRRFKVKGDFSTMEGVRNREDNTKLRCGDRRAGINRHLSLRSKAQRLKSTISNPKSQFLSLLTPRLTSLIAPDSATLIHGS